MATTVRHGTFQPVQDIKSVDTTRQEALETVQATRVAVADRVEAIATRATVVGVEIRRPTGKQGCSFDVC